MGRRGVRIEEPDRWVFNRLATDYRARPGYPRELLDRLAELAGGPGGTAVDLGAGTGLVALPLASRGLQVVAVEPAEAMLRVLREAAAPGVEAVHASAESTGLAAATAHLVLIADALHWVDPGAVGVEAARVLRRGGAIAIIEAVPAATPFMAGVMKLVEAANFKARRSSAAQVRREHLLRAAGASYPAAVERFHHSEPLAPERLDAVLRSLSLVGPAIGEQAIERLLGEARGLAASAGGAVWSRDLTLTWGRKPGGAAARGTQGRR